MLIEVLGIILLLIKAFAIPKINYHCFHKDIEYDVIRLQISIKNEVQTTMVKVFQSFSNVDSHIDLMNLIKLFYYFGIPQWIHQVAQCSIGHILYY